jgi:hypothetical protein
MANPTNGIFLTVLSAASEAAQFLQYKNAFVDRIYWDYQPIVAVPYQTLTVPIPTVNEGNVVDIGAGPIQPIDYAYTTANITLNHNLSLSYVVKDWDQVRTPMRLRDFFFRPNMEALLRRINRTIVSFFNATNFPNYTLFTGTGTSTNQITRADITTAWTNLASVGVPMDDYANVSLMMQTNSYGVMLSDTAFYQQYVVGEAEAQEVQQRARLRTQYGAEIYYDQQLASFNSGHAGAALMHRYAVAAVTADPPMGGPNVEETTIMVKGIPFRIQVAYSMNDQGWVIHMHALVGVAAVRPEMCSLFQSAS